MSWQEVLKAKSASQKKLERARKTMKRKGLKGFNKPKRVQGKEHSHIVMAKVGNKTKLIPFGQAGVKTNQTAGQRRQFKLRHAKNIKRGKMSAAYWADKVKWNPRKTKEKKNKNWRKGVDMPFKSLEQAYTLYNIKPKVFRQIAGAYGVPQLWHEYKNLRDKGTPAVDADKMIHDPRYTLKKWQNILKRVDIRSAEQYERASLDDRKKWHKSQSRAYNLRLKNLQARVNVTDEESPLYQEMVKLQELYRFHRRQYNRIYHNLKKETFYSLDLENNRFRAKGKLTPHGNPMPYQELSQEVYETLTDNEKINYHAGMIRITEGEEKAFHKRMAGRIKQNYKFPTFAASKYGGESIVGKTYTREEYENMTNDEKRKYHQNMKHRSFKTGDRAVGNFHNRMYQRIRDNSKMPVFYSPEDM